MSQLLADWGVIEVSVSFPVTVWDLAFSDLRSQFLPVCMLFQLQISTAGVSASFFSLVFVVMINNNLFPVF